ncbi:Tetratricopeptide repeat-containing protein [Carboxydocella sporoproducens DSM 16521]|uniref:Tetratricopeptide repeat-containing protein n=2 Tax=Carboxydocella TaxID=178898 RepID=A0A1T4PNC7_9FIRM|nr:MULTISPECIES: tetratricopeptide repeat protein [Carboxydocella]AVX19465.1 Tetratricopeptide repeat-containing protein [Carboxydocella thermautotrophica]GAW29056.1 hypothetical protein ULO1_16260 [Carboxydocella sp. ULO1]SJZ92717.1 Tetratricopeptide repeat-containing protein [Carboxydocella sporoproducens DSM 16521]
MPKPKHRKKPKVVKQDGLVGTAPTGNKKKDHWVILAIFTIAALIGAILLPAIFNRGQAQLGGGGVNISQLEEIVKKNPQDIDAKDALGTAYFNQGSSKLQAGDQKGAQQDLQRAIALFNDVLKVKPQKIETLGDLATAYYYTGDTVKAIELAQKALSINPDFTPARLNLAIYLSSQGKYQEAINELKKIPATSPDYATAQARIKEYQQALTQPAPSGTGSAGTGSSTTGTGGTPVPGPAPAPTPAKPAQ